MSGPRKSLESFTRRAFAALLAALAIPIAAASPAPGDRSPGAVLRERFDAMREELRHSGFGQPLRLLSRDRGHVLEGEVYALVDHPFREVEDGLHAPRQWCKVLVLPFNVKRCESREGDEAGKLSLFIARHKDSTPDDTYRLDFRFREQARDDGFLRIALHAPSGPFGTHDYRIVLEAAPAQPGHTIVHLHYAYAYGMLSQLAMQAYLSTVGADNVGFTVEGHDGGRPVFVRGMRGVMERNTMRYFLAIQAYLQSLSAPPARREEARLEAWFGSAERYPRQLHEMSRAQYLAMKRRELAWSGGSGRVAQGS